MVVFQLGVQSSVAVAAVALALGLSFGLAGGLIPSLGSDQLLRLFTLLGSQSLGVLVTLLMVLIRGLLPISLVVHLLQFWPSGLLRLSRAALVLGAGLAAAVLFLEYQLISLLAFSYVLDAWLDLADLAAVLEALQPGAVLLSCLRVGLFSSLSTLAVLERWWPLPPFGPVGLWGASAPFDPWWPQRQLPMGHLLMAYRDLFRLILIVIPLELAYQFSGLPGALTA